MAGREILILGAGGHAIVVAETARACGDKVVGYVDTVSPGRKGQVFNGAPVVGGLEELRSFCDGREIGVACGFGDCASRFRLMQRLVEMNIDVVSLIHPSAVVSESAEIRTGVYIGPRAVVEARCRIGDGVIINCGACVCHESYIGRSVTVCPGVMIGGKATIGDKTWLGIGSTIIDKITIGDNCFVGAAAAVVKDLPCDVLAFGVPARIVRKLHDH